MPRGGVSDPFVAGEREQPQRLIQQSFGYAKSEPQLNQAHAAVGLRRSVLLSDTKSLEYGFHHVIAVHMPEIYTSAYAPAMVPPRWPDEQGRLIPTYPCPR